MSTAAQFLHTGAYRNAVVIGADALSRWVEQNQREVLIGGAVAVASLAVGAALFAGLAKGRRCDGERGGSGYTSVRLSTALCTAGAADREHEHFGALGGV